MMTTTVRPDQSCKRPYRHHVKCTECGKEYDSDYKEKHTKLRHLGKKVKLIAFHAKMQSLLSGFLSKQPTLNSTNVCQSGNITGQDDDTSSQTHTKDIGELSLSDLPGTSEASHSQSNKCRCFITKYLPRRV